VAVSERPRVPIFAHWQGRQFPVRWPRHQPEPEPGDVVRLKVEAGPFGWRSFRVVGKSERTEHDWAGAYAAGLDLDVVPAPDAD
jgi:hypothetical protein